MKLIHTADLHLDSKMKTHLSKDKIKQRKSELLETFRRMVSYAENNGINNILIAGDMFDSAYVSKTTQNIVNNEILTHIDINFYYLRGNHDVDSFISSYEKLPDNLFLFEDEWKEYKLSDVVSLYAAEFNTHNSKKLYASLLTNPEKINIVMLHGQDREYAGKDNEEIIALSEFKNKGIDYLALGHIHSYKCERLDTRGVYCYPGCLEGRGFDECGEHGFVVIDIDEELKNVSSKFVPFARRLLYRFEVDISGVSSTPEAESFINDCLIKKREEIVNLNESMIEICLIGKVGLEAEIDADILASYYSNDYFYFKVKDETTIAIDYDIYDKDESLKGEFVRLIKENESLSDEEKNMIIKTGIGLLSGERL